MRLDLHTHTTWSDGDKTPGEVVALAEQAGVGMAVTDHDECRGFSEIEGKAFRVPVFAGIELAARFNGGSAHVLGLCIDWRNTALNRHNAQTAQARRSRAKRILEKLRHLGMNVDMNELEYRGNIVGRAHIAGALARKGYVTDANEAFSRYLSSDAPCYVPYEKISVGEAARLIIDAGGAPVLAHPGLMAPGAFDALLPQLKGMGFWGVEAYHPSHDNGQCREYESRARAHELFVTAGSDFHGGIKPDVALGQETRGGAYLEQSMKAFRLMAGV